MAPAPAAAFTDEAPLPFNSAAYAERRRPVRDVLLGVPLVLKIAGALALALATTLGALAVRGGMPTGEAAIFGATVVVSVGVGLWLVTIALHPLRALERTARRILSGELTARIKLSPLADADMRRIAALINSLLDALTSERERIRELAVRVVSAQDDERARISRELQDSTAQRLAALVYELRADMDGAESDAARERLDAHRAMISDALEDLRAITNAAHPRVLTDFGLVAALEWLARGVERRTGVPVTVEANGTARELSAMVAAALYRVAYETLALVAERESVRSITIALHYNPSDRLVRLMVADKCDAEVESGLTPAIGALRERIGLVDGWITVRPRASGGTIVEAAIPMEAVA